MKTTVGERSMETVADLIASLQFLQSKHGSDVPVRIVDSHSIGGVVLVAHVVGMFGGGAEHPKHGALLLATATGARAIAEHMRKLDQRDAERN
jgi:hypothetical protein